MTNEIRRIIEQIHASPQQLVLAVSGGGSRAVADLLEVPGASNTVLEAVIPYSRDSMCDWLGGRPDRYCAPSTTRSMAVKAFFRARQYSGTSGVAVGVACTAGLATNRDRRGPHAIHVAAQTDSLTATWSLEMNKGQRHREEEESVASQLLLRAVAEVCKVDESLLEGNLRKGEELQKARCTPPPSWQDIFLARTDICRQQGTVSRVVFPGAFNPLHVGHRNMAKVAEETLGQSVTFEVSILNVDKPPLDYTEIERRVSQFTEGQAVCLTRAATFEQKSRLFAGATFLVGVDTLRRIADPRYFGDDTAACSAAMNRIIDRGCRFLVFGRDMGTGFAKLGDLDLPDTLRAACREIPAQLFREDVSSTAIRRAVVDGTIC